MRLVTNTLTASDSPFYISASMGVLMYSIIAETPDAVFSLMGNGIINDSGGNPITNQAISFTKGKGYNSPQVPFNAAWDGITIEIYSGTINVLFNY